MRLRRCRGIALGKTPILYVTENDRSVAEAVYQYKLNVEWRQRIRALRRRPDRALAGELRCQTRAVVSFADWSLNFRCPTGVPLLRR